MIQISYKILGRHLGIYNKKEENAKKPEWSYLLRRKYAFSDLAHKKPVVGHR